VTGVGDEQIADAIDCDSYRTVELIGGHGNRACIAGEAAAGSKDQVCDIVARTARSTAGVSTSGGGSERIVEFEHALINLIFDKDIVVRIDRNSGRLFQLAVRFPTGIGGRAGLPKNDVCRWVVRG
jgi:hypothetical protein